MAELKTAHEWLKDPRVQTLPNKVIKVADDDGWRRKDNVTMSTPITLEDFQSRLNESTIKLSNA